MGHGMLKNMCSLGKEEKKNVYNVIDQYIYMYIYIVIDLYTYIHKEVKCTERLNLAGYCDVFEFFGY